MGQIIVLEAVIVACIMFSAIAFVASFDDQTQLVDRVDDLLTEKAWNYLAILDDNRLAAGNCRGEDELEQVVIEALSGESGVRDAHARLFPAGAVANLYSDNGRGLYPLYERYEILGHSEKRTILPNFRNLRIFSEISAVDGRAPIITQSVPTYSSGLLSLRGEALKVNVTVEGPTRAINYESWVPLALIESDSPRAETRNLSWDAGQPALVDVVPQTSIALNHSMAFSLRVQAGSAALDSRTEILVDLPSGWYAELAAGEWTGEITGNVDTGLRMVFSDPPSGSADSTIPVVAYPPSSPSRALDVIHATMRGGSFSQSSLVVKYEGVPDTSMARAVYPTTPYALRAGSQALFGAAFANGGEDTVVTQVDLEIPGGYDFARHRGEGAHIFEEGASVTRVADSLGDAGTWTVLDARHIQWRGSRAVEAGDAAYWLIGVDITDDESWTTSVEPPEGLGVESSLVFENGYESTSRRWGRSPGILEHRAPAGVGGASYPWGDPLREYAVVAEAASSRATLAGNVSYASFPTGAEAASLESSLADSSFRVSNRSAPLGSYREARADLRSLVEELSAAGVQELDIRLDMYAPTAVQGCGPTASWSQTQGTLPRAGVTQTRMWDAEGAGVESLYVGGDDGRVLRLNPPETTAWTTELGAPVRSMAAAAFASGGSLLVGDASGTITALDPATGTARWSSKPWTTGAADITHLVVDAAGGTFVAGSDAGNVTRLDAYGNVIAEAQLDEAVSQVTRSPGGEIYASAGGELARYSETLAPLATRTLPSDVVGFAVAPAGLLAAAGDAVLRVDAATFETVETTTNLAPHVLAASGDADGDGVTDLLAADDLGTLRAWSGVDGEELWVYEGERRAPEEAQLERFSALFTPSPDGCAGSTRTYEDPLVCDLIDSQESPRPVLVDAGAHGVVYAYEWGGFSSVALLDASGESTFVRTMAKSAVPTASAEGSWLGDSVVAVGTDRGDATLFRASTGASVATTSATAFVGQFTFGFQVPEGGFYGTHLLVASLSWSQEVEAAQGVVQTLGQTARFVDWFHVVEPDGTPVESPAYHIVLVVQMPDEQMDED